MSQNNSIDLTNQHKFWLGDFAKGYLERNLDTPEDLDRQYVESLFGVSRTAMNQEFLGGLSRDIRILEVGANVGNQLWALQKIGFKNLYGVELNPDMVELSKKRVTHINIIEGDAFDIPFKDNYFDLIFTSDVLIHISPQHIKKVLNEIYRCTRKYIWGFEYFAPQYTEVTYHGNSNVLWKTNFPQLYLDNFPNLRLVKQELYNQFDNPENRDVMFLLEKLG